MTKDRSSAVQPYDLAGIATATDDSLQQLLRILHERADARAAKRSRDEQKRIAVRQATSIGVK